MRQTYLMIAFVMIVVLAAHFTKLTRANTDLADSLSKRSDLATRVATALAADDEAGARAAASAKPEAAAHPAVEARVDAR